MTKPLIAAGTLALAVAFVRTAHGGIPVVAGTPLGHAPVVSAPTSAPGLGSVPHDDGDDPGDDGGDDEGGED